MAALCSSGGERTIHQGHHYRQTAARIIQLQDLKSGVSPVRPRLGFAHVRVNGDPLRPLSRPCFLLHSEHSNFAFGQAHRDPPAPFQGKVACAPFCLAITDRLVRPKK